MHGEDCLSRTCYSTTASMIRKIKTLIDDWAFRIRLSTTLGIGGEKSSIEYRVKFCFR